MGTTQATSDDQPIAVATEQRRRKSTHLFREGPISGVITTVRQDLVTHRTLQKSKGDVGTIVELFSMTVLKTITN